MALRIGFKRKKNWVSQDRDKFLFFADVATQSVKGRVKQSE